MLLCSRPFTLLKRPVRRTFPSACSAIAETKWSSLVELAPESPFKNPVSTEPSELRRSNVPPVDSIHGVERSADQDLAARQRHNGIYGVSNDLKRGILTATGLHPTKALAPA